MALSPFPTLRELSANRFEAITPLKHLNHKSRRLTEPKAERTELRFPPA